MADTATLCTQRKSVKANLTRIKNVLSAEMSPSELECRLGLLEAYIKQLLTIQLDIEALNDKDSGRAEVEELCVTAKSRAIDLLGDNYKRAHETTFSVPNSPTNKLPKLKLPSFSGKYSEYKNFIESFNQLVHNESLAKIEKFNHLIQCLSGQALDTVRAFQITAVNYDKALQRLKERYDNKTLIFLEHIADLQHLTEAKKVSGSNLRNLVDNASAIYSSLKSLGTEADICNALVIALILNKTDSETQIKWKESLDFSQLPSWEDFTKYLDRRCQFLDSIDSKVSNSSHVHDKKQNQSQHHNSKTSFHIRIESKRCSYCKSADHWLSGCDRFKALDAATKFDTVKKLGLCLNCLSEGHNIAKCTSKYKCKVCSKPHHTLLHRWNTATDTNVITTNATVHAQVEQTASSVILATVMVGIQDSSGDMRVERALLDSCSQVNLMTDQFANVLGLQKRKSFTHVVGVGCVSSKMKFETSATIHSRCNPIELELKFLITPRLSDYQVAQELNINDLKLPQNITLADEQFNQSTPIDMLLGAECFFEVLKSGQIKLGTNLPILQETTLGWVGLFQVVINLSSWIKRLQP